MCYIAIRLEIIVCLLRQAFCSHKWAIGRESVSKDALPQKPAFLCHCQSCHAIRIGRNGRIPPSKIRSMLQNKSPKQIIHRYFDFT